MSARFVRGEAKPILRKLENPDGLLGAKYKFLSFPDLSTVAGLVLPDMSTVAGLILIPKVFYRTARE
jgi:hypothetical protein